MFLLVLRVNRNRVNIICLEVGQGREIIFRRQDLNPLDHNAKKNTPKKQQIKLKLTKGHKLLKKHKISVKIIK